MMIISFLLPVSLCRSSSRTRLPHLPNCSLSIRHPQKHNLPCPITLRRRTTSPSTWPSARARSIVCGFLPVDPWAPTIDSQSIASQLFAASLFPYLAFLYFITKSKTAPKLTLFGFYFLLAFVGATIPAGIYAKVRYGTSLANVDWLHGSAESLLTLTNLFIVIGLREALRKLKNAKETVSKEEEKQSSV